MSVQSDAATKHLISLFQEAYPVIPDAWSREYPFAKLDMKRNWRFDFADHVHHCAIELDGATFKPGTGHNSGVGLRGWREKNNAAMAAGWRVFHYAPEEIIRAGRKSGMMKNKNHSARADAIPPNLPHSVTLPDEPVLKELPWLAKREEQQKLTTIPAELSGTPSMRDMPPNPTLPGSAKGEL